MLSGRSFCLDAVSNFAHVVSDLIKKLLMVTVFYRDNVYVGIRALNGRDIHCLTMTDQLLDGDLFPKVGP